VPVDFQPDVQISIPNQAETILFPAYPEKLWGPTQTFIQWLQQVFFVDGSARMRLMGRLKMRATLRLISYESSLRGAEQTCLLQRLYATLMLKM
jgi:hypothetical protein